MNVHEIASESKLEIRNLILCHFRSYIIFTGVTWTYPSKHKTFVRCLANVVV